MALCILVRSATATLSNNNSQKRQRQESDTESWFCPVQNIVKACRNVASAVQICENASYDNS